MKVRIILALTTALFMTNEKPEVIKKASPDLYEAYASYFGFYPPEGDSGEKPLQK